MIIEILELKIDERKQARHGDAFPGIVSPKVVPRYVEEFRDSDMNRDFAKTV